MKIENLMTRAVHCCRPLDPTNRAAQIMWEHDCGAVPVVDEERRVVGMLTDRDVCMAAYTTGRPLSEIRVADVMSRDVRTCALDDSLAVAEALMKKHHVRRLPVVDADRRLVGILALADVARGLVTTGEKTHEGLFARQVAETLAEISRPWSSLLPRETGDPKTSVALRTPRVSVPLVPR